MQRLVRSSGLVVCRGSAEFWKDKEINDENEGYYIIFCFLERMLKKSLRKLGVIMSIFVRKQTLLCAFVVFV